MKTMITSIIAVIMSAVVAFAGLIFAFPGFLLAAMACQILDVVDTVTLGLADTECSTIVGGGGPGCGYSPGTDISANVPSEWRGIISAAAASEQVPGEPIDPDYLAALFLTENGNRWKPPDTNWPTSPKGASGPMQFMPATWAAYGVDGNGDGRQLVDDPVDAMFGAARLVSSAEYGTVTAETPLGDLQRPWAPGTLLHTAAAYNAGPGYVAGLPDDALLERGYAETQSYLRNMDALLRSDLTAGGHPSYDDPDPHGDDGQDNGPQCGGAGNAIVDAAAAQIGVPYSWGGGTVDGPSTGICCASGGHDGRNVVGFDCSHLVQYAVYQASAGEIDLLPPAAAQATSTIGREVGPDEAGWLPGDLLFNSHGGRVDHVAIYAGDGKIIEAPQPGQSVQHTDLWFTPSHVKRVM